MLLSWPSTVAVKPRYPVAYRVMTTMYWLGLLAFPLERNIKPQPDKLLNVVQVISAAITKSLAVICW